MINSVWNVTTHTLLIQSYDKIKCHLLFSAWAREDIAKYQVWVFQRVGDRYNGTALFKHLSQHSPSILPFPLPLPSVPYYISPLSLPSIFSRHTHTHTAPFSSHSILTKPNWSFFTVPAACWDGSSVFVGGVSVCSGCSAWALVRPMAAPLGRHGTLLLWSSVAEAPLLRAGAPAVCNASTVVGGARLARLTDLTTEPRLSLPPPL